MGSVIDQTRVSRRPPRADAPGGAGARWGDIIFEYVSGPCAALRAKKSRSSVVRMLHNSGSVPGGAATGMAPVERDTRDAACVVAFGEACGDGVAGAG
jgi:hypothetical protein